ASDWSSDVCSSDLAAVHVPNAAPICAKTSPSNLRKQSSERRRRFPTAVLSNAIPAKAQAAQTAKLRQPVALAEDAGKFDISRDSSALHAHAQHARGPGPW